MSCDCDGDVADIYNAEMRRAQKPHRGDECAAVIEPGARYERVFGVWDGNAMSFKTRANCLAIRDYMVAMIPCFCWSHGDALNDAKETAREYAADLMPLAAGAPASVRPFLAEAFDGAT